MPKKIIQEFFETPAIALDESVKTAEKMEKAVINKLPLKKAEEYWNTLGPGLITGAADDDPSGIATYSQTGAKYGFQLLWLAAFTFPLMAIVQEMCARIGLVTGRGLAANIKRHFPRWVLYLCTFLLFFANSFNIGADLGAMVKAVQLVYPQASFFWFMLGFTFLTVLLQVFTTYARYAKYLKYLVIVLFSYVISAFVIDINWSSVLKASISPTIDFSKDQIFLICGILGTTISPYLFFWQTSQEVEEEILDGKTSIKLRQGTTDKELKKMRIDVWSGMFISNAVMVFIIAVCAATLFSNGITNITSASDAAQALRPLAGEGAYFLFTIGIIGTGLLAIPILAGSASYAVSESFGWKSGLYKKLKQAHAFYGVIIVSMAIGFIINFINLDPIKALIYSAVANGIISPIILALIVLISSNKLVMGDHANRKITKSLGWIITLIMAVAGTSAIISLLI